MRPATSWPGRSAVPVELRISLPRDVRRRARSHDLRDVQGRPVGGPQHRGRGARRSPTEDARRVRRRREHAALLRSTPRLGSASAWPTTQACIRAGHAAASLRLLVRGRTMDATRLTAGRWPCPHPATHPLATTARSPRPWPRPHAWRRLRGAWRYGRSQKLSRPLGAWSAARGQPPVTSPAAALWSSSMSCSPPDTRSGRSTVCWRVRSPSTPSGVR